MRISLISRALRRLNVLQIWRNISVACECEIFGIVCGELWSLSSRVFAIPKRKVLWKKPFFRLSQFHSIWLSESIQKYFHFVLLRSFYWSLQVWICFSSSLVDVNSAIVGCLNRNKQKNEVAFSLKIRICRYLIKFSCHGCKQSLK